MRVVQYPDDFAELKTKAARLAIGSKRTLPLFGRDHVAHAAQNQSAIIEFKVADVDAQYNRLSAFIGKSTVRCQRPCHGETDRYYFMIPMEIW